MVKKKSKYKPVPPPCTKPNSKSFKPGNQANKKLTTSELKQEAYRQYCEHLASGGFKEAFVFDHPELTLTAKTMEKYIREDPAEFPIYHKEVAEAKGMGWWTQQGKDMMLGGIKNCQPAIYQIMMRNKYKWDREQNITHSFEPECRTLLDKFEKTPDSSN